MMTEGAWYLEQAPEPDEDVRARAQARQDNLTKPVGALGKLESIAVQLAALQRSDAPHIEKVGIAVFAADHGVTEERVSAYPQSVTREMLRNFATGGAAISVLARELGAPLKIVDVGTASMPEDIPEVLWRQVGLGTRNICRDAAMNEQEFAKCMDVGAEVVDSFENLDLFIGGEMGIGNSTVAAAIAVALTSLSSNAMVGRGTGIDDQAMARKAAAVTRALSRHLPRIKDGGDLLRRIGGFEINALAAAYIRAAQKGIVCLVDGYICTAAAMAAARVNPSIRPWLLFSHCSAEPGHARLLNKMEAEPLINLDMRLGEGSGAAVTLPILKAACALHNGMASFDEAGISRDLETPRRREF